MFEWSVIWDALPSLMEGARMTVRITLLGLVGGTLIGFLAGVVTTYVRVPVTWKTVTTAFVALIALVGLAHGASWVVQNHLPDIPTWVWVVLQSLILFAVVLNYPEIVPVALSFLAQIYILVIRGTPIVVQVMFIYFALPLILAGVLMRCWRLYLH